MDESSTPNNPSAPISSPSPVTAKLPQKSRKLVVVVLLSILLIAVVSLLTGVSRNGQKVRVNGSDVSLTPSIQDSLGVDPRSVFILASKLPLSLSDIKSSLQIKPALAFEVAEVNNKEFKIFFDKPLEEGKVYSFELATAGTGEAVATGSATAGKDLSWAFQIKNPFRIVQVSPRHKATFVPINSGVEITFSHEGYKGMENSFEINPKVEGRFETHKRTAVFIPKSLQAGAIYTVTVKKGVGLAGSLETLKDDYVFQFETAAASRASYRVGFSREFSEFPATDAPAFSLYLSDSTSTPTLKVDVYKFSGADTFLSSVAQKEKIPSWASYNRSVYLHDLTGPTKVLSFDAPVQKFQYSGYFVFPQALPDGYYIVNAEASGNTQQAFLQVTSVATYFSASDTKTLVWVNDLSNKLPVNMARVDLVYGNISQRTNEEGVAFFDTPAKLAESETLNFFKITTPSGKSSVAPIGNTGSAYYGGGSYYDKSSSIADAYWSYLYLDRPLYLPTDVVNFWGIIRNRNNPKDVKPLKAVLTRSDYRDYNYDPVTLSEKDITPTEMGTFIGKFPISNLQVGYYTVEIKIGGDTIAANSFNVQTYTKPAYRVDLEPAKKAIFAGEAVEFKGKVSFFEGSPVPGVSLKYSGPVQGTVSSDGLGEFSLPFKPGYTESADYYTPYPSTQFIGVTPVLSEEGEIEGGASVLVFGPRISLKADSLTSSGTGTVKLAVNNIDLEKINNGTAKDNNDYLGVPAAGQLVSGKLYEYHWDRKETGERYDFINKITVKTYEYVSVKNFLNDVSVMTDSSGQANYSFPVGDAKYYELDLESADTTGRKAKNSVYLYGERGNLSHGSNYYYLESNKKDSNQFSVGEQVNLTFKRGDEATPSSEGKYIFRVAQRGIKSYKVQESPTYNFNYDESFVPNVVAGAVYFNGKTFIESESLFLSFNKQDKKLTIDITPDKTSYKPGDTVNVDVKALDKSGRGQKAEVNLSLVDEAIFKLQGQEVDTLGSLYKAVSSGVWETYVSHQYPTDVSGAERGGCFLAGTKILLPGGAEKNIEDIVAGDSILTRQREDSNVLVAARVTRTIKHLVGQYLVINNNLRVTPEHNLYVNGRWMTAGDVKLGDSLLNDLDVWVRVTSIEKREGKFQVYNFEVADYKTYFANRFYVHNIKGRELFTDNAFFGVVTTDNNGYGKVSFPLPDNLTSWRVTYQGISDILGAGNGTTLIPVKLPFFVDAVLSSEYLEEDKPIIKIRAYGDGLKVGQAVTFNIQAPTLSQGFEKTASAKAFESVPFILPSLSEGDHKITISARSGALEDTLIRTVKVIKTRLSRAQSNFQKLTTTTSVSGSANMPTTLIFSDANRGRFYPTLLNLYYTYGDRVDQKVTRIKAGELMSKYFSQKQPTTEEFKAGNYQGTDGGISLLPYSSSDLMLSAKIAATAAELFDKPALRQYFYKILNDSSEGTERTSISLFGLASLEEPVLVPVKSLMGRQDLTVVEKLYLGLAMAKLGDKEGARSAFGAVLSQYGEEFKPMIRLKVGKDQDDILEATALAADLASLTGENSAEGLLSYIIKNYTKDILIDLEQLLYVTSTLPQASPQPVQFTWATNSQKATKILKNGGTFKMEVSPAELSALKFENISGSVGLTSLYFEPFDSASIRKDNDLSISRSYSVSGSATGDFGESDLIEVRLLPKLMAQSIDGCYQVSDLLPSGLKIVTKLYSRGIYNPQEVAYPYEVSGQKVSFCVAKSISKPILYYARVASAGDYKAESAVVQSLTSTDSFNVSPATFIKIK